MNTPNLKEYLHVREHCALREAELNDLTLELCRSKNKQDDQAEEDWVIRHLYNLELRRKMYQNAMDVIDGKNDISVQDIIRVERYFEAQYKKNGLLLEFYWGYENSPLADILNIADEIKVLETDKENNAALVRLCEERLFGELEEKEAK